MRRGNWMWVTCLSGLSACDASPMGADGVDGGLDAGGVWQRCTEADLRIPGVQWHDSGGSLQCFCPAGEACNYGWSGTLDVGPVGARGDAGMDSGTSEDTGFSDAPPMDDAALDALSMDGGDAIDGAPTITDDASL